MLSNILVGVVALLHFNFLYLEMFLWTKPAGLKIFKNSAQRAQDSQVLAANQGLYNGFLAAGLIWSILHPDVLIGLQLKIFFLICVIVAGVYGAMTFSKRILYVQAAPALIALAITFLTRP